MVIVHFSVDLQTGDLLQNQRQQHGFSWRHSPWLSAARSSSSTRSSMTRHKHMIFLLVIHLSDSEGKPESFSAISDVHAFPPVTAPDARDFREASNSSD
ncbi:hypothetical protein CRG98_012770 [Punica granatum]|uniref:Uncharacterized protein n=1 Tax=Punica granatum TaxID=22663 RepID=A0A2I0KE18_PUNGR|nr:hypothetical protein CRG98_012770 [Punica granatum]